MPKRKKSVKKQIEININKSVEKGKCHASAGGGGCFYFMGFIGSAVYYISTATGFWNGALGLLKALVWPAFLVFEVLKYVGA